MRELEFRAAVSKIRGNPKRDMKLGRIEQTYRSKPDSIVLSLSALPLLSISVRKLDPRCLCTASVLDLLRVGYAESRCLTLMSWIRYCCGCFVRRGMVREG